jgi:hypothetical protein
MVSTQGIAAGNAEVFTEFNKEVDALPTALAKETNKAARFSAFVKSKEKLTNLRKKNPRQSETQEINMSLFMGAFASFPKTVKAFKAQDCEKYLKDMRKENRGYMADAEPEPYVEKALKVAESICK